MSFTTLPPVLGDALAARGYANPTPVQAAVLQDEARGRDLVVSAQTGSGKTVAFGMAMATELRKVGADVEEGEDSRAARASPSTGGRVVKDMGRFTQVHARLRGPFKLARGGVERA